MNLGTVAAFSWPDAAALLGLLVFVMFLIGASMSFFLELRKTKLKAAQQEDLRQLVRRYEQLAENTLDAQQRVATDVSELLAHDLNRKAPSHSRRSMTDPPVIEVITEPKGGHASVSFTLDRYGHLYVERLSGPLGWRDGASTCGSVWWA